MKNGVNIIWTVVVMASFCCFPKFTLFILTRSSSMRPISNASQPTFGSSKETSGKGKEESDLLSEGSIDIDLPFLTRPAP